MAVTAVLAATPVASLRTEYINQRGLYESQPVIVRKSLEQQALAIAQALTSKAQWIHFSLPDRIASPGRNGELQLLEITAEARQHRAGSRLPFGRRELSGDLKRQFSSLERSVHPGLSLSGMLLRFGVAHVLVHRLLPDGRLVRYLTLEGDEIPSQPLESGAGANRQTSARVERQDSYPPAALRFFLPQWVAFDEQDQLLTTGVHVAEAILASLGSYVTLLEHAAEINPCIVADEVYQRKRTGILGQLVNQGRALARYHTRQLIEGIQRRAAAGSLNRGLSLSLEYFDEGSLEMKRHEVQVIPNGRVMFVPGFMVLAVRREYERVAKANFLRSSTRSHLFSLLAILEEAFLNVKEEI